jgi:coenzyme PQQ synthesis protein D (PqqD)
MIQFNIYQKNPSVVCAKLDEGAVLLNVETKYYYNLNETGLRIWEIMEELQNPLEVARKLSNDYKVDIERAKASVIRLVEELQKEGLIISKKGGD